jgi:hypothetical protein
MARSLVWVVRNLGRCALVAAVVSFGMSAAYRQAHAAETGVAPGRIDFEAAKLPAATVEVDLSAGMFGDLVGLGEAAIAGVAETLQQATGQGRGSEGTRIAAEQLAAARELVQLARGVVHEVRVRAYKNLEESGADAGSIVTRFDEQLRQGDWETIVRVRDGDASVRVSLLRKNKAILGAFVIAAERRHLVLANIVGDVSPENVQKLTAAAATIGLENGLPQVLDAKLPRLRHRLAPAGGSVPLPPLPPKPPAPPAPPSTPRPAEAEAEAGASG